MGDYADIEDIAQRVATHAPRLSAPGSYDLEAAVAVCLRPGPRSVEALFIRRSEHPEDPWSGDAAFPGGRREGGDTTLWETAMREAMEETGVDLAASGRLLGRLDDVHPRVVVLPNLNVASFVAALPEGTSASALSEVVAVSWIPLVDLADPARAGRRLVPSESGAREFPSIRFEDLEIWGLTHRILTQLLGLLGK